MSDEALPKGKDTSKVSNKLVAVLQRGLAPTAPSPGSDYHSNDLAAKLDAKLTFDAKIRLLLAELQSENMVRMGRAVIHLNSMIQEYAIPSSTIMEIWAIAKKCLASPELSVRQETLQLMARCIELQKEDLHTWQRVSYYDIIQKYDINVGELAFLEHALYKLCDEGKNVGEITSGFLEMLSRWLSFCSTNATGQSFDESECGKQYRIAFFISERVFQYSFSKFEDQDVTAFMSFLCNTIGTSTGMLEVIGKILDIIEVIPKYGGVVPITSVPHIVSFICSYASSRLTEQFSERFWQVMYSLLRLDHIAHKSMMILESVPAAAPAPGTGRDFSPRHWQKFRIRGALIFLGKCLKVQKGQHDLKATLSVTRAIICIQHAIGHSDLSIAHSAIDLLEEILSNPESIRQMTYEDWDIVWDTLAVLVREFTELFRSLEIAPSDSVSSITSDDGRGDDRLIHNVLKQLEKMVHIFQEFCVTEEYTGSLFRCVTFQMILSKTIPDPCDAFILAHYEKFHLCMPTNATWLNECEVILEDFIRDDTKLPETRLRAIALLAKVLPLVTQEEDRANDDFFKRIVLPLLKVLRKERNGDVCAELVDLAVQIANSEKEGWALEICKILNLCASELPSTTRTPEDKHKVLNWRDSVTTNSSHETVEDDSFPEINFEAVKGMADIFENSLSRDASAVSQRLFSDLVRVVQNNMIDPKVRMEALDVLLRLRADSLYSVYMTEPLMRRNGRIPVIDLPRESPPTPRRHPWSPENSPVTTNGNGVQVLDAYITHNRLKTFDDHVSDDEDEEDEEEKVVEEKQLNHLSRSKYILPVSTWLDTVISLCRTEKSWELYYHLIEHFAEQLANKTFFVACNPQIIRLREIICSQLINSILPDLDNFNNQKRIEVIMRLHKLLTVLIGYHIIFVKASRDELVRCFQINMGRYNPVLTKQCIHSLMVCCHELPKSIARCLSGILQTLSHQITNPVLSVHILEFLIGVGRIPKIHGSFTYEEFSMVFQVALRFLQHSRATARERTNMTNSAARMSQYIIYLAYEALTVWFLAVKLENRRAHVSWIIRQLLLANESSGLDDQALVFVDMLERFSYSDSPLRKYPDTADPEGLAQYKKHWVVGRSVQTAQVVREDGLTKVTVRKPASMLVTYMQAEVDFDSDAIRAGRKVLSTAELNTLPSYMMTQVHSTDQPPILLSEDESTLRSIRMLDRMPVVNFHTIGITYVGWGQTTEEEILSNETGSLDYEHFLEGMGTIIRLKGNTEIYHGGLDINDDLDGTHAYFWSDRTTQITFITYTMIPLQKEGDRRLALSNKKRNAANCFVNIIWNDSNEPYSLDTIASEFNSNSIVISRHSRSSSETDTIVSSETNPTEQFFLVKLVQTDGMPEVSPIVDEKIISASSLAPFVRSVALKLSIFCQIYIGRQEKSHWVARLDQIHQIRDRALQKRNSDSPVQPRGPLSPSISNATLSTMGRRTVSETRVDPHLAVNQKGDEDPLTQWLAKYDFSRYT